MKKKNRRSEFEQAIQIDTSARPKEVKPDSIADRVNSSQTDRQRLCRVLGIVLVLIALLSSALPIYYWVLLTDDKFENIPVWICVQGFFAFLYLIYGTMLIQIPDWSTLKSVAVATILIATVYGFMSAALTFGRIDSQVTELLNLPYSILRIATSWCIAMLILNLLISYISGSEAFRWQRLESLFRDYRAKATGS